jgi:hypothetical protein
MEHEASGKTGARNDPTNQLQRSCSHNSAMRLNVASPNLVSFFAIALAEVAMLYRGSFSPDLLAVSVTQVHRRWLPAAHAKACGFER